MTKSNEETAGLIIVVAIVVVLILGYNLLGKIKTAPITLVPTGTQQAINPSSQAAYNAQVQGTAAGLTLAQQQQYLMMQQQQQSQNQINTLNAYAAIAQGVGDGASNIIDAATGNDYYNGY